MYTRNSAPDYNLPGVIIKSCVLWIEQHVLEEVSCIAFAALGLNAVTVNWLEWGQAGSICSYISAVVVLLLHCTLMLLHLVVLVSTCNIF